MLRGLYASTCGARRTENIFVMAKQYPVSPGRIEHYTHEAMVNWLGPQQLLQTGIRAAVATTLSAFADPREVQAALNPAAINPPIALKANDAGPVWVDYVADTGDGWNSTHSVAWCVSRDTITLADGTILPRGDVLVLGGDQVYPTPAQGGYRTRFIDPFRSAFPAEVPASPTADDHDSVHRTGDPLLLAAPGNHDWYDGLRAFTQLFCEQQPIGRWRTAQRTSYFALELPHGWWLWGLDLQLESAMDRPQRQYFEDLANKIPAHARVILCAPEPSWIDEGMRIAREDHASLATIERQTPRYRSLKKIEELLGARLALVLAGDLHLYARYAPKEGSIGTAPQRITCGGGGAYLLGTHDLPEALRFRVGTTLQNQVLQACYPEKRVSRRLRNGALGLPVRNLSFCAVLASLYLLFLWVVQSASKLPHPRLQGRTAMESFAGLSPTTHDLLQELPAQVAAMLAHSPGSVLLALAVVLGCGAFTRASATNHPKAGMAAGMLHGLLHLALAVALLWGMAHINLGEKGLRLGVDDPLQVTLFVAETLGLGGFFGGLLYGMWMVTTNALFGWHAQEVFSSQRIADYKCFLRMRIDATGLTIFPMKIDKACTRWKLGAGIELLRRAGRTWRLRARPGSGPRFVPDGTAPKAEPIEPSIHIAAHRRTTP